MKKDLPLKRVERKLDGLRTFCLMQLSKLAKVTQTSFLTSNTLRQTILNLYACPSHFFPTCACALAGFNYVAFPKRKVGHEVPSFSRRPGFARPIGCANGRLFEL
jgi:hypothetical protein